MLNKNRIYYSEQVDGDERNFNWPVVMDWQDGYLGVSQYDESGRLTDRVLLSPAQANNALRFNNNPSSDRLSRARQKTVLTEFDVRELRKRYAEGGTSYKELANEKAVSLATVAHAVVRRTWKWVK